MKRLCKNKYWKIDKNYDIDKILYLLIDRPFCIDSNNDFYWLNNKGQYHRDYDLPAIVEYNKSIEWWKHDNYYRENYKPTIICKNGSKK